MRPEIYDRLLQLGNTDELGRKEAVVATVERLILHSSKRVA